MDPKDKTLAIVGLVLGILSIVLVCCCYGLPFNIAGAVVSVIAMNLIKNNPEKYDGYEMAVAGLITSILSIVLVIVLFALGMALQLPQFMEAIEQF